MLSLKCRFSRRRGWRRDVELTDLSGAATAAAMLGRSPAQALWQVRSHLNSNVCLQKQGLLAVNRATAFLFVPV